MSAGKLSEKAKGVYIIAATPFTEEGALDLQSLDTLTDVRPLLPGAKV